MLSWSQLTIFLELSVFLDKNYWTSITKSNSLSTLWNYFWSYDHYKRKTQEITFCELSSVQWFLLESTLCTWIFFYSLILQRFKYEEIKIYSLIKWLHFDMSRTALTPQKGSVVKMVFVVSGLYRVSLILCFCFSYREVIFNEATNPYVCGWVQLPKLCVYWLFSSIDGINIWFNYKYLLSIFLEKLPSNSCQLYSHVKWCHFGSLCVCRSSFINDSNLITAFRTLLSFEQTNLAFWNTGRQNVSSWKGKVEGWQAAEVFRLCKDNPLPVLIWRFFNMLLDCTIPVKGKTKSSKNDARSCDVVAAGPVYLQVWEG